MTTHSASGLSLAALSFDYLPKTWAALVLTVGIGGWAANVEAEIPPPPKFSQAEARSVKGEDLKATVTVEKIKIGILQGDELGHSRFGWFCGNEQPMVANEAFLKNYGALITSVATQELKRLGYPLAGAGKSNAFDTDIAAAPDFRMGGILKEAKFEICSFNGTAEGWIQLKIDWALYSERLQKVVYQASAEGLGQSKDKISDLAKRAMISSLSNFVAAPEFLQALKAGKPDEVPAAETASAAASAAASAQGASAAVNLLTLKGGVLAPGGALKNQAVLRAAVVTLETASGSGSGFYIDRDGYLLTNVHVVKGAKFVKVKMQNGDKLVAQVLKINERNDVALLKTPSVELEPLSLRASTLDVGEDVFAIGSPLGVLTNSMTRGVLSADRTLQGRRVLQSDAAVTFGSSGGPLLDAEGRVVAITQGGVAAGKGFNFFIPIQDALHSLDLSVK
ncbi:S1C family serine protease [Roseateles sp. PN1]|uniref:S1C family serine protease n=1 Tax=Roseateles sp. PN1 TaxID=3137372 RepID=UPI0031397427